MHLRYDAEHSGLVLPALTVNQDGRMRLFQPVKLGEYALPVIASKELYEAQSVREDARVYFNSVRRCS